MKFVMDRACLSLGCIIFSGVLRGEWTSPQNFAVLLSLDVICSDTKPIPLLHFATVDFNIKRLLVPSLFHPGVKASTGA